MTNKTCVCLLCLLLLVGGCVTGAGKPAQPAPAVPPMSGMNPDKLAPDIKLVVAGIIERMRGSVRPVPRVSFDPAGKHYVGEPDFHYEGFSVKGLVFSGYSVIESHPDRATARVEGTLVFKDPLDRCTSVFFAAMYTVTSRDVVINKSMTVQLPPVRPYVDLFMVPADKLKAAKNTLTDYPSLYMFCLEHAVPMVVKEGESTLSPEDDYIIMGFCRERMAPSSILEMRVTDKKNMLGTEVSKVAYIYDRGWRIMLSGGKFRPGSRSSKFYVGVRYKQDPRSEERPVTVANFENKKHVLDGSQAEPALARQAPASRQAAQPAPQPQAVQQPRAVPQPQVAPQPQAAPPARTASVQPSAGPLERGVVFLNPIFPEDVGVIQARLKELGYYSGPVDSDLGPGTRKSLDDFAGRNGFPKGLWSLGLQKVLFKGSGR